MLRYPTPRPRVGSARRTRPRAHRRFPSSHGTVLVPALPAVANLAGVILAVAIMAVANLASTAHAATALAALPGTHHASGALDGSGIAGERIALDDLARITGGFCTTCSSDGGSGGGGGGGGTGTSGSPTATGSPYWSTYRVSLNSSSTTPASLVNQINNYSGQTVNGTFEYTRTVVRDVQFSGGYATFVKASVGGEVSSSTRTSVTYPIAPRTYGKLYVAYRTERRTYYGRQYQDFTDGTRTVVDSDSGPFLSTTTVLGYVTGGL